MLVHQFTYNEIRLRKILSRDDAHLVADAYARAPGLGRQIHAEEDTEARARATSMR